jgi:hypothetical protein
MRRSALVGVPTSAVNMRRVFCVLITKPEAVQNVARSTARQRLGRFGFRINIGFVIRFRGFRQLVSGRSYRRVRTLRFTETLVGGIDWHDTPIPAGASLQSATAVDTRKAGGRVRESARRPGRGLTLRDRDADD